MSTSSTHSSPYTPTYNCAQCQQSYKDDVNYESHRYGGCDNRYASKKSSCIIL